MEIEIIAIVNRYCYNYIKKIVHKMSVKAEIKELKYIPRVYARPHTRILQLLKVLPTPASPFDRDIPILWITRWRCARWALRSLRTWGCGTNRSIGPWNWLEVRMSIARRFCEWAGCVMVEDYFHLPNQSTPKRKAHVQVQDKWMPKETIDILYQRRAKKLIVCKSKVCSRLILTRTILKWR